MHTKVCDYNLWSKFSGLFLTTTPSENCRLSSTKDVIGEYFCISWLM